MFYNRNDDITNPEMMSLGPLVLQISFSFQIHLCFRKGLQTFELKQIVLKTNRNQKTCKVHK